LGKEEGQRLGVKGVENVNKRKSCQEIRQKKKSRGKKKRDGKKAIGVDQSGKNRKKEEKGSPACRAEKVRRRGCEGRH